MRLVNSKKLQKQCSEPLKRGVSLLLSMSLTCKMFGTIPDRDNELPDSKTMSMTRLPEPDEVECLLRNAELRDQIEPFLDESIFEIDFRLLPTPIENRFLESMIAWECAPLESISKWFDPPLVLPSACDLDDDDLLHRLTEIIELLFEKRVILDFTDHLSDRELYRLIRRDILPAAVKRVDIPDNFIHWNCSSSEVSDDPTMWLIYYASDSERLEWMHEHGLEPPPRRVPPYPRMLPTSPV